MLMNGKSSLIRLLYIKRKKTFFLLFVCSILFSTYKLNGILFLRMFMVLYFNAVPVILLVKDK